MLTAKCEPAIPFAALPAGGVPAPGASERALESLESRRFGPCETELCGGWPDSRLSDGVSKADQEQHLSRTQTVQRMTVIYASGMEGEILIEP